MKSIIVALLFCGASVLAQNTLSGIVSDPENNPIQSASVFIPEIQKGTTTDSNGKYIFSNLPRGTFTVGFAAATYISSEHVIAVTADTILNVTLELNAHQMDEVVVSTAFNKLQSQNVMKVDRVTVESLEQNGMLTLSQGLSAMPGVESISTGTSIGKPVIRGLSGNRVIVYSQGMRIENQQFGSEHGLGLNESGIENIEVIKGPASLLYGSDAIGGVLYLNTEKFADANSIKGDVSQRFSLNTLGSVSSAALKTSTDNWKFLIRGNYAGHSDYMTPDKGRVTNTRFNERDAKAAMGYNSSTLSTIIRYNFNLLKTGIPEGIGRQSTSKSPDDPKQIVESHLFSVNNKLFFDGSTLETTFGYIANDRKEFEDGIAALHLKLNTLNYDLRYHFPRSEKFESIVGIQGMTQQNRNFGEERLIPDAIVNDFGIYGKVTHEWDSNTIEGGIRYDLRSIRTNEFGTQAEEGHFAPLNKNFDSFNLAAGYKRPIANFVIRMNLASGFRSPNLSELTSNGVHEGTNRYEIGNASLKTERSIQADLNIQYKIDHFDLFVNGFYNRVNDYIYLDPTGESIDENAVYTYRQDHASLYGGEAGFHFHPHPLDFLHFETSFETVRGRRENGHPLPLIPADNLSNSIRAETNSIKFISDAYATIDVLTYFDQSRVSEFETPTGGYTLVNFGIGGTKNFRKSHLDFTVNVNNLFDRTYISHLSRLKPDNIPDIGRNVILSLKYNWK